MRDGKFKIAKNTQNWWGFTLQRGHAFGLYKGVCYVSAAEPDTYTAKNIVVYRQKKDKANVDYYRWSRTSIPADSELGKLIRDVLANSPYDGVQFRPERHQTAANWKPMPDNYKPNKMEQERQTRLQYDDTPWRPGFPTFQTRRPETTPKLPRPTQPRTWVDYIYREAMA